MEKSLRQAFAGQSDIGEAVVTRTCASCRTKSSKKDSFDRLFTQAVDPVESWLLILTRQAQTAARG